MFVVFPRKRSFETTLSPKQIYRRFDKAIIPFKARGSVVGVSNFIKKYKTAEVYYGYRNGEKIRVSHHAPRKTDGSSTTFYGSIKKVQGGSVIQGKIMKPLSTCIFGAICIIAMLFLALVCAALKIYTGAAVFALAAAVTFVILFRDGGKSAKLTAFLEEIIRNDERTDKNG